MITDKYLLNGYRLSFTLTTVYFAKNSSPQYTRAEIWLKLLIYGFWTHDKCASAEFDTCAQIIASGYLFN